MKSRHKITNIFVTGIVWVAAMGVVARGDPSTGSRLRRGYGGQAGNGDNTVWTREIPITGKYLLLPIKNGGKDGFLVGKNRSTTQILDVFVGEMLVHSPNIYLAHHKEEIDWWAKLDLSEFVGKTARVRIRLPGRAAVDHMPADSKALKLMETSNELRNLLPLYDEPMRPQFHFSQQRGWNNDPNGMVYYDGEYHLFWQSNPVGKRGSNKYWGHAVSPDMVHWKELRPALRDNGQGPVGQAITNCHPSMAVGRCHSGGGNVDHNNTGGFQAGEHKTMILTYTDTGEGRGRNLTNFRSASPIPPTADALGGTTRATRLFATSAATRNRSGMSPAGTGASGSTMKRAANAELRSTRART